MRLFIGVLLLMSIAYTSTTYAESEKNQAGIAIPILREQFVSVWPEIKDIATAPFKSPEKSAKWGLFLSGFVLVDKPLTQFYQKEIVPRVNYSLPNLFDSPVTQGADGYLLLGITTQYLGGLIAGSRKAQETSIMAGKAVAYSYLFSQIVGKTLTGRNRPYPDLDTCSGGTGPYTCDPVDFGHYTGIQWDAAQGGTAMPSFHFTMYFSVARVYARSYDNYWVPYTVMAGLLGSDAEGHHHWVSDMVAGALLGTFIGNRIVDAHEGRKRNRKFMSKWDIYPYAVPSGMGLYLTRNI